MLVLLCSGICLFLGLGFGAVMCLIAFPVLFFKFPAVVMAVLEFLMSLGHFYWDIFIFLLGLFFEVAEAILNLFINALPIIITGGTHLYHTIAELYTVLRYHYFPQLWDFFNHQRDLFLLFWGFLVASVYTVYNQFTTAGNEMQHYRHRDNNDNIRGWNNDGALADDFDDPVDNIRNERIVDDFGTRRRNRDRHTERGDRQNNQVFEEQTCVVCFESDRNAAVFPCGHTQTCLTCTRNIMGLNRKCPICQRRIAEYRQVFL